MNLINYGLSGEDIIRQIHHEVFNLDIPELRNGVGKSVGLTIKLPNEQNRNPYLDDFYDFYYFFTRKVCLTFAAEAYV